MTGLMSFAKPDSYERTYRVRVVAIFIPYLACKLDPYSLDLQSESMSVSERIQTVDLWSEQTWNGPYEEARLATFRCQLDIGCIPKNMYPGCLYSRNYYN